MLCCLFIATGSQPVKATHNNNNRHNISLVYISVVADFFYY